MHSAFGPQPPPAEGERIVARSTEEGENDYSPSVIRLTPPDSASPAQERAYRYEHVVFLAWRGAAGSAR